MIQTPVLFCVYNRPDVTQKVFDCIADQRPKHLLISGDGPKNKSDVEQVEACRRIVQQIDWPCELTLNFSERNLGCAQRMASAITWGFELVPELIILEDDCLPSPTFFGYCESLLQKYRDESRVMMISGNDFQPEPRVSESYYFSNWPHIWGWASWRNAWEHFDLEMSTWQEYGSELLTLSLAERQAQFWTPVMEQAFRGQVDTWDYAWAYAIWRAGGLTVLPRRNLVSNLGFGPGATHTTQTNSPLSDLPTFEIDEIEHPGMIEANVAADTWTFDHIFQPSTEPETPEEQVSRSWFPQFGRSQPGTRTRKAG